MSLQWTFSTSSGAMPHEDIALDPVALKKRVARFLERYGAQRNSFGGFRVCFGRWVFDLWTFDRTWAFSERFVEGRGLAIYIGQDRW